MRFGRFQNGVAGHHHAQINDFVVIATQDNRHDIFANVMHVPFYRCHNNGAFGRIGIQTQQAFFGFNKRL